MENVTELHPDTTTENVKEAPKNEAPDPDVLKSHELQREYVNTCTKIGDMRFKINTLNEQIEKAELEQHNIQLKYAKVMDAIEAKKKTEQKPEVVQ